MIDILKRFDPVGEEEVIKFESKLGWRLPSDFRDFLVHIHGWNLEHYSAVEISNVIDNDEEPFQIDQFYVIHGEFVRDPDEEFVFDIEQAIQGFNYYTPRDFLVIASGPGSQYLIDLRPDTHGIIYVRSVELRIVEKPILEESFFTDQGIEAEEAFR